MATGTVDVGESVTTTEEALVDTTEEEVTVEEAAAVAEGRVLVGAAVGTPPFRHVQALEIFAGTLDQRAAYAGRVWVGALV